MAWFIVIVAIVLMGYVMIYLPYKNRKPKCIKCHLPKKLNEYNLCESCMPTDEELDNNYYKGYPSKPVISYTPTEAVQYTSSVGNSETTDILKNHFDMLEKLKKHTFKKEVLNAEINLNVDEIIFLKYLDGKKQNSSIAEKWAFHTKINYIETIQKFFSYEFIHDSSPKTGLSSMTIVELKEILKSNSLKLTGKKIDLIERILSELSSDDLLKLNIPICYELTEKGQQLCEKNKIFIDNWNDPNGFSLSEVKEEIEALRKVNPNFTDNDIRWSLYNTAQLHQALSGDWGIYRNTLMAMGAFLEDEKKFPEALVYFCAIFILDISGMSNGNMVECFDSLFVAPGIIRTIKKLSKLANIDTEKVFSLYKTSLSKFCRTPFSYFNHETSLIIFKDCFLNDDFNFENYRHLARKPSKNSANYTYDDFSDLDLVKFPHSNRPT